MKPENAETINQSFERQAPGFESNAVFSKEDYLRAMISSVAPDRRDTFLEVASGTCVCGRAFAPLVQTVVCLDATVPMLQIGRQKAAESGLDNIFFVKGYAEELPFLDESFSAVFSRLAFHHFLNCDTVFSEMVRVLRPGGRLVMIDMEAADKELRSTEDAIERLRDPSHVKNLSRAEMHCLFSSHGLVLQSCETTEIQQNLDNWLALMQTPEEVRREIVRRMQADMDGGEKTGFSPYQKDGRISFSHRWVLTIGLKKETLQTE